MREDYYEADLADERSRVRSIYARRPVPGVAAVLSVLLPGLGHVYAGRLPAGLGWFLAAAFGYWAVLVPGFLIHVVGVWAAYQSAKRWRRY